MTNNSGDPLILPDDGKTPTDWRRVWREFGAGILAYLRALAEFGKYTR